MKRIYTGLTIVCVLAAFGALVGALQMIQRSPGLDLIGALQVILISGDAIPGLVVGVVALIAMVFAGRLKDQRPAGRIVIILGWIAALTSLGLAGWKIYRVLDIMRMLDAKAGGLAFRIRAPGYAEILLIATIAFFGAGLAFGLLKIMTKGQPWRPRRSR